MPLDLAAIKKTFFDTKSVKDALTPEVRKALSRFGAFVRQRSKTSIKKGKGTSQPGRPPLSHNGDLKRILFGYDASARSVLIGPVLYGAQSGAPDNLEHGGVARLKSGRRVNIKPRPFMQPAFEQELKNVGHNFKNLIK